MTLAILAKLRKAIVAVADGRLSRPDGVSFDTAAKIIKVRPTYFYPRSSIGTVEQTGQYHMFEWCLVYAGTYALASEIREEFRRLVGNMLVDRLAYDRVDFVEQFSGAHRGDPDFHISLTELPKIPRQAIIEILKEVCQKKGDEWMSNRSLIPDVEFLLFGTNEETREYEAYRFYYDVAHTRLGHPVTVRAERVGEMSVVAIGEPAAVFSALSDQKLLADVAASIPQPAGDTDEDWLVDFEPSQTLDVARRMASLVDTAAAPSIGGQKLMAIGDTSHNIIVSEL